MGVIIRKKFWNRGSFKVGYLLGKVSTHKYFVQYATPEPFRGGLKKELKSYKTLEMAERYIVKFEKQWPAR